MTRNTSTQWAGLIAWVLACFLAGGVGAVASRHAPQFYRELVLPAWAPPAAVFGPVWTTLYLLMGIAAWLVWRRHGFAGARNALLLFIAQLVLNALWTWLYFAWRNGAQAFGEIVLLGVTLAATVVAFWRLHRVAALLLLPYLAWVGFAACLTYVTWRGNPGLL